MSRERIQKIARIRAIDERAKELNEINVSRLNQQLGKLREEIHQLEVRYRNLNQCVEADNTKLSDLNQLKQIGQANQRKKLKIETATQELETRRNELIAELRRQQMRIDQWDRLLENLHLEIVASQTKQEYSNADEAFLAKRARTQS